MKKKKNYLVGRVKLYVGVNLLLTLHVTEKMVRPVIKMDNRSTEMEIKALKLSSDAKDNLRAPAIWEKPVAAVYNYHYEIGGLYYQVQRDLVLQLKQDLKVNRIRSKCVKDAIDFEKPFDLLR